MQTLNKEEDFMENKISRRAFLKCAGTTALAVGTASLLGGCGPVDDAVSSVLGDNAIMMSGVGFAWVNNCGRGHCDPNDMDGTKGESYFLYAVKLSVANLAGGSVTLNHSDFTFTINGQESEVLYGDSFAKYADVFGAWFTADDLLLDADGIRNIPLNPTGLGVPHGWLAFKLKPVEGRDIPWEFKSLKLELTIHRNGEARSMTLTYDAEGNDSMSS